jgi:glycosyltransferase involved in cell wall biosynthesis
MKVILVGPLPPSWGGARVSFKIFYDYITKSSKDDFFHYDLPVRFARDKNPPGSVNHIKTLIFVLLSLFKIPFVSSVVLFGSRNFCLSYGILFVFVCKLLGKKCYIRFFGGHPAKSNFLQNQFTRKIIIFFLNMATKIIVETHVAVKEFPYFIQNKIEVIYGYRPLFKDGYFPAKKDIVKFVYVGSVSKDKGVGDLLNAFLHMMEKNKSHFNFELHIYGSVSNDFLPFIVKNDRIFFHGKVDNNQVRKSLLTYDVFIFPSKYVNEGHPGAIIEAFMAGLPVISTDLSGPKEIIKHEYNGLIVPVGNVQAISLAMQRIVEDKNLRINMGNNALESSKKFSIDNILPKLAKAVGIEV